MSFVYVLLVRYVSRSLVPTVAGTSDRQLSTGTSHWYQKPVSVTSALDQHVIDNAMKQWRKRLQPAMLVLLQTETFLTSVVNVIQLLLIMLSFIVTQTNVLQ